MDIRQLRSFIAIVEERKISAAAKIMPAIESNGEGTRFKIITQLMEETITEVKEVGEGVDED